MSTTARINLFQRLIRRWDAVHPYNAAQAMELQGRLDLPRWQRGWDQALAALRLGPAVIDGDHYSFAPMAESQPLTVVGPETTFEQHMTLALNRPFAPGAPPFRPFVKQLDDGYFVGLAYQHWVADSVAIRMVLREWFAQVIDPRLSQHEPVKLALEDYWSHFGPHRLPWAVDQAAWRTVRRFSRFRGVRRLHSAGSADYSKSFLTSPAPPGIVPALRSYSRLRGVALNDVFLAALMEQCARHLPFRLTRRRRDLALGTIVDLRRESHANLDRTFGLFLGFAEVIVREELLGDFDRALRSIHVQNDQGKRDHIAAAGTLWLGLSRLFEHYLPAARSYQFYRRHMPLAGGISNVNLNHTWAARYHPDPIRRYVRASPTGPMIPVAFTPTTLGDDLHLALTYRTAVLAKASAQAMMEGLLGRLGHCAETACYETPRHLQ